jgi:effector-binding domain-containing protein
MKMIRFSTYIGSILLLVISYLPIAGVQAAMAANYPAKDTPAIKITIEKTVFNDMNLLFISDTAATTPAVKDVLGKGYGELMQLVSKNQLQPTNFMAWYYAAQPPWPMDIAVEVNRMPENLEGRIRARKQPGGEVLIAHMRGPYDQVGQAYQSIAQWLKENKRQARSAPFEIYKNDPAMVKDPSEIQTDVYQPLK